MWGEEKRLAVFSLSSVLLLGGPSGNQAKAYDPTRWVPSLEEAKGLWEHKRVL
jgi:hypothetical protein